MGELLRGKSSDEPLAAQLLIESETPLDLTLTPRGHSRREVCDFPPLKLDFKKNQVPGTLFDGQNKIKLVTHCKRSKAFSRYLQQEYAIYKAYASLTDAAFRVRMLDITYRDSAGKRKDIITQAFLIESDRELATRLGLREVTRATVPPGLFDPGSVTTLALFQLLIGNTDWAIVKGRGEGACCHNGLLLESPKGLIVVPYDFDQAGLINAQYALPAQGLGIRSVRQRRYRGLCVRGDVLQTSIKHLQQRRDAITDFFPPQGPYKSANQRARKYIDAFYTLLDDPGARTRMIDNDCRGNGQYWNPAA